MSTTRPTRPLVNSTPRSPTRSVVDSTVRRRPSAQPVPTRGSVARIVLGNALHSENSNFYLLLGTVTFLVVFGLLVVFSASSIGSYLADGWFFGGFVKQAVFAMVGVPLMLIMSKLPLVFWRKQMRTFIALAFLLQLSVFSWIGIETGGNRNWIAIGSLSLQPSELIKPVLAIWLGVKIPEAIDRLGTNTWEVLRPVLVPAILMGMVLVGKDLGTVMIMAAIVMGCLFFSGLPLRILTIPAVIGSCVAAVAALFSSNRMDRILSFLNDCTDYANTCWQPLHGKWAMANGGIFGVGLGNSKSKWSWLPAADNDYIFAIIGEELGLIGCIVVILLFILLAVVFLRIIRQSDNRMVRITTAGIMTWIIGQAAVNIGVVVGILPVLGVPLPFLSAGGTALLANLGGIGIVLSFARAEREKSRKATGLGRRPAPSRRTSPGQVTARPLRHTRGSHS